MLVIMRKLSNIVGAQERNWRKLDNHLTSLLQMVNLDEENADDFRGYSAETPFYVIGKKYWR